MAEDAGVSASAAEDAGSVASAEEVGWFGSSAGSTLELETSGSSAEDEVDESPQATSPKVAASATIEEIPLIFF
ncbi:MULTISPECIES: hypothetical protein [unclassified Fibrobacter]|uniref:hypothetical protein n=1 Tax=unclassified Fibrobacter TaxID=2634177 RepID=UPI001114E19A|nr:MULTISPECIES: hypothetical protein [unclassified Fibrobacter]